LILLAIFQEINHFIFHIRRVARFAEREGEGMACVFDKFQAGCVKKGELMPAPPLR
jgi:hypothetical protein